jgi:DNA-binding protein YbaB
MLEDLLGNAGEHQKELEQKLQNIEISKQNRDGSVKATVNAKKQVIDISIGRKFTNMEELEDQLVFVLNEALDEAEKVAVQEANSMLKDILPGSFGDLFS